ncbi:MAG: hypothetical protein RLZZ622_62 [Planctomycetota bacterium]
MQGKGVERSLPASRLAAAVWPTVGLTPPSGSPETTKAYPSNAHQVTDRWKI